MAPCGNAIVTRVGEGSKWSLMATESSGPWSLRLLWSNECVLFVFLPCALQMACVWALRVLHN